MPCSAEEAKGTIQGLLTDVDVNSIWYELHIDMRLFLGVHRLRGANCTTQALSKLAVSYVLPEKHV